MPISQGRAAGDAAAQQDRPRHVRDGQPGRGRRVPPEGGGERAPLERPPHAPGVREVCNILFVVFNILFVVFDILFVGSRKWWRARASAGGVDH